MVACRAVFCRQWFLWSVCDWCTDFALPVSPLLGRCSDGPWNQYEPEAYKLAYRRIVTNLRAGGVTNFAAVWQSATSGLGTFGGRNIWDWWPGDGFVDWAGLSYFVPHAPSLDALLAAARYKRVPVLICEAAPQGYDLTRGTVASINGGGDRRPVSPEETWARWFAPFFAFVRENYDVVRGVSYVRSSLAMLRFCFCDGRCRCHWRDTDDHYSDVLFLTCVFLPHSDVVAVIPDLARCWTCLFPAAFDLLLD